MIGMPRILLILLCSAYSLAAWAQPHVEVEIQGISGELKTNVELYLSLEQQKNHPLLSAGRIRRLYQMSTGEIGKALQPFGYYRPKIDASLVRVDNDTWRARYSIETGPQLPLASFDFAVTGEAAEDPAFQALTRTLPLTPGHAFDHLRYEELKAELTKLAAERGYFAARFLEHKVEIDLRAYQARIILHFDSGPRYRFGAIRPTSDVLEPGLLRRYLPFARGEPYDLNQVIQLQQALSDSDYFRVVEVSPGTPDAARREVPVNILLTPRKHDKFTIGIGYGSDTGARTRLGWQVPRVNRRGHRFDTELKLSQIGYSLSSRYAIPLRNPRTDQLIFDAGVVHEETGTSTSTLRTVGASINRSRGPWREVLALNYQAERFEVAGDHGRSTLLMPGVNWSRIWGGRRLFLVLDGVRLDLGLRGANDRFLADTTFFQATGSIKAIRSLGARGRLIARGSLGSTWTRAFSQLPSSVRFFAGGSQSVRGYAYHSLGPTNAQGQVVGGRDLLVGSLEYDHRLIGNWSAALFYDRGNAIDALRDPLESGAGFGLRWQSPVGPVRVDIASARSRPGRPWRLHINIGPDL